MKRHLYTHFRGDSFRPTAFYKCSLCSFKSDWQFLVKKHIISSHLSVQNAYVMRSFDQKNERNLNRGKDCDKKYDGSLSMNNNDDEEYDDYYDEIEDGEEYENGMFDEECEQDENDHKDNGIDDEDFNVSF